MIQLLTQRQPSTTNSKNRLYVHSFVMIFQFWGNATFPLCSTMDYGHGPAHLQGQKGCFSSNPPLWSSSSF
ncbi:hypothetical protein GBA52_003906 [Prunus armeniaca]|nr:hypothetical protein GBA52_003906 [Prunus armeniaca]